MTAAARNDRELLRLLEIQTAKAAQDSLLAFAIFTRSHYDPNWHHERLCDYLDRFARGEIARLIVSMPPRHGKSELVSRCLPAYLLGRNPDVSIIATSYSDDLASRMNRDVQRIIDSPDYAKIFPKTKLNSANVRTLSGSWLRNSSTFEVVGCRGSYRSAGILGSITGMGPDHIIIDDPIKNQEQARSATYREKIWDEYTSTLYTRADTGNTGILVTMTRWHEDDLAGRLLRLAKEDPAADQWAVVSFPAVQESEPGAEDPREEGGALWPDRFPLEVLEKNKAHGAYIWGALFQQRPAPLQGNVVQRDWLHYYGGPTGHELPEVGRLIQSWDMTFKKTERGSFVVGQTWGEHGTDLYLLDQARGRWDFADTLAQVIKARFAWPKTTAVVVEEAANGPAVISMLKKKVRGLVAARPRGSKEARLQACSPLFEAGNVWLPHPTIAPWVVDLVEELVTFPNAENDDQVDALSQALDRYRTRSAVGNLKLNLDVGMRADPLM